MKNFSDVNFSSMTTEEAKTVILQLIDISNIEDFLKDKVKRFLNEMDGNDFVNIKAMLDGIIIATMQNDKKQVIKLLVELKIPTFLAVVIAGNIFKELKNE